MLWWWGGGVARIWAVKGVLGLVLDVGLLRSVGWVIGVLGFWEGASLWN